MRRHAGVLTADYACMRGHGARNYFASHTGPCVAFDETLSGDSYSARLALLCAKILLAGNLAAVASSGS